MTGVIPSGPTFSDIGLSVNGVVNGSDRYAPVGADGLESFSSFKVTLFGSGTGSTCQLVIPSGNSGFTISDPNGEGLLSFTVLKIN